MKKQLTVLLLVAISFVSFSQSINVTFQVDMSIQMYEGNFPPGANVVVRGNFQNDFGDTGGNWQGNLYQLSDPDSDDIYTATFNAPSSLAGNTYIFKFVIVNPPAGDNWESSPDRQFTLNPPSVIIPVSYFNNDTIPIIIEEVTNTINFTADISGILGVGIGGAFDPNQDSLLVMGLDWDNYGKNIIGNRKLVNTDPFNSGIYRITLTVTSGSAAPNGVGDSTAWKFVAFPNSRFANGGWETGSDRWHYYVADGSVIDLPFTVPRIWPKFGVSTNPIDFTLNVRFGWDVRNRYNGEPIPVDSIDYVVVLGSALWLGGYISPARCWCPDDTANGLLKVLTRTSATIWSYHTIVDSGNLLGPIDLKFGVMYPGADTVNCGIAFLDNEFPFDTYHTFLLTGSMQTVLFYFWFGEIYPPPYNVEQINNLIPDRFILEQNYPNPFNPSTKIRYSITEYSSVSLKVFNLLGEEIVTLFNGEQSAGVYEATFNASNLSSGIYFYTLKTNNSSFTKKMLLVR